ALVGALMQAGDQAAAAVVPVADGAVAVVLQLLQLVEAVVLVTALPVQRLQGGGLGLQVAVLQATQGVIPALLLQDQLRVAGVAAVELAAGFLMQGVARKVQGHGAAAQAQQVAGAVAQPVDRRRLAQLGLLPAAPLIVLVTDLPDPVIAVLLALQAELAEGVIV